MTAQLLAFNSTPPSQSDFGRIHLILPVIFTILTEMSKISLPDSLPSMLAAATMLNDEMSIVCSLGLTFSTDRLLEH
jgi:hypothetical protein